MARIVMAHVAQDEHVAERLEEALTASGHHVIGPSRQPADAPWALGLAREIIESDCVLALVSPAATHSTRMMTVMRLAERRGRRISVLVGSGDPPRPWTAAPCVDLRAWPPKGQSADLKALLGMVESLADRRAKGGGTLNAPAQTVGAVGDAIRAPHAAAAPARRAPGPISEVDRAGVDDARSRGVSEASADDGEHDNEGWVQTYPHGPLAFEHHADPEGPPQLLTVEEIAVELISAIDPPVQGFDGPKRRSPPSRAAPPSEKAPPTRASEPELSHDPPHAEAPTTAAETAAPSFTVARGGIVLVIAALFAGLLTYAWRDHRARTLEWESANRAWASAQTLNSVEGYRRFLREHPESMHRDASEAALSVLRRMGIEATRPADEVRAAALQAWRVVNAGVELLPRRRRAEALAALLLDEDATPTDTALGAGRAGLRSGLRAIALLGAGDLRSVEGAFRGARASWGRALALRDDEAFAAAEEIGSATAYAAYLEAFPKGRHVAIAKTRQTPKPVTRAASARAAGPSPPPTASADGLHPRVAEAAARARAAADAAAQAAKDALSVSQQAKRNAALARAGRPGYGELVLDSGVYAGALLNGRPAGLGVLTLPPADGALGDEYYAGAFSGGVSAGLGVYATAAAAGGADAIVYSGQWGGGAMTGLGVMNLGDGVTISGEFENGRVVGDAVAINPGGRYEGEWRDDAVSGYGVLWDKQRRVQQAGRWEDYQLTQPLTP